MTCCLTNGLEWVGGGVEMIGLKGDWIVDNVELEVGIWNEEWEGEFCGVWMGEEI